MRRHIILFSLLLMACTAQALVTDGVEAGETVAAKQAVAVNHARLGR